MSARLNLDDYAVSALLCLVMFSSGADMLVMTPILPQICQELGVSVELGGQWVTGFAAATAIFALVFGPISDRFGRRPVLLLGLITQALGTGLCGMAEQYETLFAARALAGAGSGLLVTSTTSFVGDHFPVEKRAVAMGYVMGGFFLSLILGVPAGAALAGFFGWSMMFLVFATKSILALVLVVAFLPKPAFEKLASSLTLRSAAAGYAALLRSKKVVGIMVMSACIGISMTMFAVYSSPWLEATFGLDTTERGMVYAVGGPAALIGGPLAGRLSNVFGRVMLVVAGSLLMGAMQLLIPFSDRAGAQIASRLGADIDTFAHFGDVAWPLTVPTLIVFFFIMLAGSSRSAPFQTLALEVVPSDQRGAVAALRNGIGQGGRALGAALGGILWAAYPSASDAYATVCIAAALVTLVGIISLRLFVGLDGPMGFKAVGSAAMRDRPRAPSAPHSVGDEHV